jgi:hypothetical protein
LATSQAALFGDARIFGVPFAVAASATPVFVTFAGGAPGADNVLTGPNGGTGNIPTISAATAAGGIAGIQIPLGNNVMISGGTNEGSATLAANTTFTAVTKHITGNTYYGADDSTTAVFMCVISGAENELLVEGSVPASDATDNFTGATLTTTAGTGDWVAR